MGQGWHSTHLRAPSTHLRAPRALPVRATALPLNDAHGQGALPGCVVAASSTDVDLFASHRECR